MNINKLPYNLGTIKNDKIVSSGLKIDMFNGEISDSSKFLSDSSGQDLKIPQIDIEIEWNYEVVNSENATIISTVPSHNSTYKTQTINDKVVKIKPETPILRAKLDGSFDLKDNL